MWRSLLSAVLASAIIITAQVFLPITPPAAPVPYEAPKPSPAPAPAATKPASTTPAQVKVVVESLEVDLADSASQILRTDQVTVKARFSYAGTTKTDYRVQLLVDGKAAKTYDIQLLPGTREESLRLSIEGLGKHKLTLGDKSCTIRIVEPGLPVAKKETGRGNIFYNHGMEDVLETHIKNIDIAYSNVPGRLDFSLTEKLNVYVYASKEDTVEGIRTIGKEPVLADRYNTLGIAPEPINDVMHTGSGSIVTCLNLFTYWTLKKKGIYYPDAEWIGSGIAEYLSYDIGRASDKDLNRLQRERILRLAKAYDEGKLLPLAELENQSTWAIRERDGELSILQHDEAFAAVSYIAKKWGFSANIKILRLKMRQSTENAVQAGIGARYIDLEPGFKSWIIEQTKASQTFM